MSENIKITIESISKIVAVVGGFINGFKFFKNLYYRDKLEKRYGFDGNNLDSFTWINSSELIQGIVQIFLMIIMFYSISTSKDLPNILIIVLNFIFIGLMIIADTLACKKSGDFSVLKLGSIIFIIIIVVLAFSEEYRKLNFYEKFFMFIIVSYIVLVIMSLTQVIDSLFPNIYNKKTYEIIRINKTNEVSRGVEELFVKIARTDDGFLSFRCKILNKNDISRENDKKIKGKKHKRNYKCLFIEKGRYRFIDPKKVTIENISFDEVRVLKRRR